MTEQTKSLLEARVRYLHELAAAVLGVEASSLPIASPIEQFPDWDSVMLAGFAVALSEELQLDIDMERISSGLSIEELAMLTLQLE